MDNSKIDQIISRSEFVEDLLGKIPPFLVRIGSLMFLIFIFVLLLVSNLIRYPDTVQAKITLTSVQPSVHIFSKSTGAIKELYKKDNSLIKKGESIALIENSTSLKSILKVEEFLRQLDLINNYNDLVKIKVDNNLDVGSLQDLYSQLVSAINDEGIMLDENSYLRKARSLANQIQYLIGIQKSLNRQEQNFKKEVSLIKTNYERNLTLYKAKVLSKYDMEQMESSYLKAERDLEAILSQKITNSNDIEQKKTELQELGDGRSSIDNDRFVKIKEKSKVLRSAIEGWKQSFLIRSPIDGIVTYHDVWSKNQYVGADKEMFIIVPKSENRPIGKMILPELNSGKVKIGQKVIVSLDGYNYKQYGALNGHISSISLTPKDNMYLLNVRFPDKLITTYGKPILNTLEIHGEAKIVTEDLSLFDRIFYTITSSIKNN